MLECTFLLLAGASRERLNGDLRRLVELVKLEVVVAMGLRLCTVQREMFGPRDLRRWRVTAELGKRDGEVKAVARRRRVDVGKAPFAQQH